MIPATLVLGTTMPVLVSQAGSRGGHGESFFNSYDSAL